MKAIDIADDERRSLVWTEVEDPTIDPGQVLVRSRATAINRADLLQRRGLYAVPPGASRILGLEVAGVIEQVGSEVSGWQVGDRVCALLEGGGYGELVAIDASMLLRIPDRLDFGQAAAVPEVFYTAWLNVFMEPSLQPGEVVIVHAAASGVGTAAVQLCRAFGHRCLATASGDKLEVVSRLGASLVIDRREQDFVEVARIATDGRGVDVILDPVGGSYLADNLKALAIGGRLVNIGLLGGPKAELDLARLLTRRLRIIGSVLRSRTRAEKVLITEQIREHVWPKLAEGSLEPVVHVGMGIEDAEAGHALLEQNATTGKVVLLFPG